MKLRIAEHALEKIHRHARRTPDLECLGFLAARRGCETVTEAVLLPATVSAAPAEASPEDIVRCVDRLRARRRATKGMWHSHGQHGVFHSGVDCKTTGRLLPQMASWCYQRPPAAICAPTVTDQDEVSVVQADGRTLRVVLLGRPIHGMVARERQSWTSASLEFLPSVEQARVIIGDEFLRVEGGGVAVVLGIPDGAELASWADEAAAVRIANVFSIVVNSRGDQIAECMEVHNVYGVRFTRQAPCEIEVVGDGVGSAATRTRPSPGVTTG